MEAEAFLQLALRARRDPAARAALPGVFPNLDWSAVLQLANSERVTPLLFQGIKDLSVPPEILERLRTVYYESVRTNIIRFQQLEQVLAALSAREIPVVLLKGAALAEAVYGSVALRPMTDLDLLIHPEHLDLASTVVTELGFVRTFPYVEAGIEPQDACEVQFTRPDAPGFCLELHWHVLLPPYYRGKLSDDWLWQTAVPCTVGHQQALTLGPEAKIIHICAHLCLHHHAEGLLWYNDVAEVIACDRNILNWPLLLEKALETNLAPALQMILPVAVSQLGAPVPDALLDQLAVLPISAQEKERFRRSTAAHQTGAQLTLQYTLGLPDWPTRLRYAFISVFPSLTYMRERYRIPHPLLTPLFYPYRWITGLLRRR